MRILYHMIVGALLVFSSCRENEAITESDPFFSNPGPELSEIDQEFINELGRTAESLPNIYSCLILKDKSMIYEGYYNGANKETLLHIRSITKSISSILIGIALEEGAISNTNEKVSQYFQEYIKADGHDQIEEVTLQQILDMQTGFEWNENVEAVPWYTSISDTWGYFFEKEIVVSPGTVFNYNSGAVSLLTRFIENNQGLTYQEFAQKKLFEPLLIQAFSWEKDGLDNTRSDAGLQLRASDLVKLGYLMMHQGEHQGAQIIPQQWITESWRFKIDLTSTYGPIENMHYNNLWWMGEYADKQVFFGLGYGGQLLLCVPDHDLVVVCNHEFRLPGNVVANHSQEFLNRVFKPLMDHL